jgi:hypothetical protein
MSESVRYIVVIIEFQEHFPFWRRRSQSTSFGTIGLTSFVVVVVVLLIFFLSFGNNFIVLTISCYVVGVEFKCNWYILNTDILYKKQVATKNLLILVSKNGYLKRTSFFLSRTRLLSMIAQLTDFWKILCLEICLLDNNTNNSLHSVAKTCHDTCYFFWMLVFFVLFYLVMNGRSSLIWFSSECMLFNPTRHAFFVWTFLLLEVFFFGLCPCRQI